MDYLSMQGKKILVVGVANRKSVAWHIADGLVKAGAEVLFSVKDEKMKEMVAKLFPESSIYICNVENEEDVKSLGKTITQEHKEISGLVHSIAFANYSEGLKPFHETLKKDFLQAVDISCFSLISLSNALKDAFTEDASVITISISSTRTAAQNYGYMAPIKAALDSSIVFLAKSFSQFSKVRFNSVNAGLLKTSASAGIPGYIDSYLFAEKLTLRKQNLQTPEVARTALFLLSPASSGINAQNIVIDAGMGVNTFEEEVVHKATH